MGQRQWLKPAVTGISSTHQVHCQAKRPSYRLYTASLSATAIVFNRCFVMVQDGSLFSKLNTVNVFSFSSLVLN